MLRDLVLVEDGAAMWIKTDSEKGCHHFRSFCAETIWVLRHGDGMVANDAEVELIRGGDGGVLEVDPVSERAEVVAEMRNAGGLNAREDDFWSRL